jgi:hypothetical protein
LERELHQLRQYRVKALSLLKYCPLDLRAAQEDTFACGSTAMATLFAKFSMGLRTSEVRALARATAFSTTRLKMSRFIMGLATPVPFGC